MRLLCASNLHLGRRIADLPEHAGLDPARTSASAVWNRLASAAVSRDVDAVLLSGDVIDREAGLFEPAGALQQGLGILERHNIPAIAIAGDDDFDALPRAIAALRNAGEGVKDDDALVMLDAQRPSFDLARNGDLVTIVGVSQSGQAGLDRPLAAIPQVEAEHPVIAILHASLTDGNAPKGAFQPVRLGELAASGTDIWILGAQRKPDIVVLDATTVIEPGAAAPAGPDETGMHGATLVEIFNDGVVACEPIPLAPVQFEDIDIDLDLTGIETLEATESAVVRALDDTLESALAGDGLASLGAVLCMVHLTGATPLHAELPAFMEELSSTLAVERKGVTAAIQRVEIDTQPDIDIEPLLGRPDPVGELARLLRALDGGDELSLAQEGLVRRAVDRLIGAHRSRVFAGVAHDAEPNADMTRTALRREAWNVLDALVRQRGVE